MMPGTPRPQARFRSSLMLMALGVACLLVLAVTLSSILMLSNTGGGEDQAAVLRETHPAPPACSLTDRESVISIEQPAEHKFPGGHWFHVAEMSVPYHSMHRGDWARDARSDAGQAWGKGVTESGSARILYVRLPSTGFYEDTNPMSRLIAALGLAPERGVDEVHFLAPQAPLRVPDGHEPSVGELTIPPSFFSVATGEHGQPAEERFKVHATHLVAAGSQRCVRDDGAYGAEWPKVPRGSWFPNAGDKEAFGAKLSALCGLDFRGENRPPGRRVLIYQRDLDRRLANIEEVHSFLESELNEEWTVEVHMHDPAMPPCLLAKKMWESDVLVTPHGFQSLVMLFMRPGSLVFEVYPAMYYKPAYRPLALELEVNHDYVQAFPRGLPHRFANVFVSTETCMAYKSCRSFARGSDVELSPHGRAELIYAIHEAFYHGSEDP